MQFYYTKVCIDKKMFSGRSTPFIKLVLFSGLLNHLRQLKLEEDASGKADNVTLFLFMAFLSAIDLSVFHSREDGEEVVKQLPILSEPSFLRTLYEELSPTKPKWSDENLQAAAMFGLSVTLSCLRLVPQTLDFYLNEEKEADFITAAVDQGAFRFLNHKLLENELVHSEQFVFKRLHYLVTDFIIEMISHVRQLKMLADASSRMELVYSKVSLQFLFLVDILLYFHINYYLERVSKKPLLYQIQFLLFGAYETRLHFNTV